MAKAKKAEVSEASENKFNTVFKVGDIITGTPESDDLYERTQSGSIMLVTDIIVDQDGNQQDCPDGYEPGSLIYKLKILKRESEPDVVGMLYGVYCGESEYFKIYEGEDADELLDLSFATKGWINSLDNPSEDCREFIRQTEKIAGARCSEGVEREFSRIYMDTRSCINIPRRPYKLNYDLVSFNINKMIVNNANELDISDISCGENVERRIYENFVFCTTSEFLNIADKIEKSDLFEKEDTPEYLVVKGFKDKHLVTVYKNKASNEWIYISNKMTDEVVALSVFFIAEKLDIELSESIKSAILSFDYKIFNKSLDAEIRPFIEEREKLKRDDMFERFVTQVVEREKRSIGSSISHINEEVCNFENKLSDLYRKIRELKEREFYYMNGGETSSEFVDFVKSCKSIVTAQARCGDRGDYMDFDFLLPITFWNENDYRAIRKSKSFNPYENAGNGIKQLMDDIFIHRTAKLVVENKVRLHFPNIRESAYLEGLTEREFDKEAGEGKYGFVNPHQGRFNCFGDNKSEILKAINNLDYISAVEQAIGSISTITITDQTVFCELMNRLCSESYHNKKCVDIDGKVITISDYLKMFRDSGKQWNRTEGEKEE